MFSESFILDWHAEWTRLTPRSARTRDRVINRTSNMFYDSACEYVAPLRMLYWLIKRMVRSTSRSA